MKPFTSLSLALRLGLPHKRILHAIERTLVHCTSRECSEYFTLRTFETARGRQERLWLIHGWQGAFLFGSQLPRTPAVVRWHAYVAEEIGKAMDAIGMTDAQAFAAFGVETCGGTES